MTLKATIEKAILAAMKAKKTNELRGLRDIKAQLLLLETSGNGAVTEAMESQVLQKMAKQRQDSLSIYEEQGREDLAKKEREELELISTYLPKQLDEEDLKVIVQEIITSTGAAGMKDMGKVMGVAKQKIGAAADGKTLSGIIKSLLN